MNFMTPTPLIEIDSKFTDLGGPGAQPFQLDAGMRANGLDVTQAAPQAVAPQQPRNDFSGLVVSAAKPMAPNR